jgi:hypothetical protein
VGIFDIFTNQNAQDAANAQIAGIQQGQQTAQQALAGGNQALTTNYTAGLQPFLTNYGQAQGGVNQYLAALGIGGAGGAAGAQQIQQMLQNTPGYQFQLNQGTQNVLRNAAQTGTTASGATLNALQNQGQGLANTTYQQYLQNLQPFLGASGQAAGGIGSLYSGLGQGLNQNANTLAQLGWTANTGIGNAQANADLAANQASANIWNLGGNIAKLGASVLSDVFTKFDIHKVGRLDDEQNVYSFRYKADPARVHIGLMAQEVEQRNPEAVTEVGGVKFVDYGKATEYAAMFEPFLKAA